VSTHWRGGTPSGRTYSTRLVVVSLIRRRGTMGRIRAPYTKKWWPVLAGVALAGIPGRALAETAPPSLELVWNAPEGCPPVSFIRRRIEQIVRGPETAPTRAEATVKSGADGRFHVVVVMRTADGEESRTLDADSCSALAEAVAVVVAFMIDPSSDSARIDEPEPAPPTVNPENVGPAREMPPSTTPPKADHPGKASRPARGAPTGPPLALAFGLGGSVASGPLPEIIPGIVASAAIRLARFRVGALGTVSFRQRPHFDHTAGASFDMIEAGAFAGYLVPLGVFALGPCANLEATYVHVRSFGIRRPWESSIAWVTAVLGARVEARVTRWLGVFARSDLLLPIEAPAFILATRNDGLLLHEPAPVALRLSLGAEFVLP
jgi:hypothetical protein